MFDSRCPYTKQTILTMSLKIRTWEMARKHHQLGQKRLFEVYQSGQFAQEHLK